MAKQLKKYMAVTTASFMVMQLAACGNATEEVVDTVNTMPSNEELEIEEVHEVPDDMTSEEYANIVVNEQLVGVSDSDMADACEEWQEDEDGSYECLDENSPYYTQHFFNGLLYASAGAMVASTIYKSHNRKNGTEKERIKNSAIVSPNNTRMKENDTNNASGGGGGSYSGGSKTTTNNNATNEANTNATNSAKTNTNGSSVNTSGSSSSNSNNTSGSTSNGSNSYSSGSNSNSSNSYSNSSSSNSGKSGFGSGGGSRGGSSSS